MRKNILFFACITLLLAACQQNQKDTDMRKIAVASLQQSFDNNETIKIISVSQPDSTFGLHYVTHAEVMYLQKNAEEITQCIMEEAEKTQDITKANPYILKLAEKFAASDYNMVIINDEKKKDFSGYRVKIKYVVKDEETIQLKSERWVFLSKDKKHVLNAMEFPLPMD